MLKKPMSSSQILVHVKRAGTEVSEEYDRWLSELKKDYQKMQDEGPASKAGFLFAFSELANQIGRDNKVRKH